MKEIWGKPSLPHFIFKKISQFTSINPSQECMITIDHGNGFILDYIALHTRSNLLETLTPAISPETQKSQPASSL